MSLVILSISSLGIALPTSAEVLASQQARLQAVDSLITNLNPGGVAETILEALSVSLGSDASTIDGVTQPGAYELLEAVMEQAYISSATGAGLDLKAADVGVKRKQATAAGGSNGIITLNSVSGSDTTFQAGAILQAEVSDPTQPPITYATTQAVTIPAGQTTATGVAYIATQAGSSGNQPQNAINQVVSGLTGATFINNGPATEGTDTEQDDSPNGGLRARALAAIPNASECTKSAIENAALSYPGIVTSLLLTETADDYVTFERGINQLFVDDGTGNLGSAPVVEQIQNDLNGGLYRAAGCVVHVHGSQILAVILALSIDVSASYVQNIAPQSSIVSAVQAVLFAYVNSLGIGRIVYLSTLIEQALLVPGVTNVHVPSVLINGSGNDLIPPQPFETPHISSLSNISVTVVNQT